MCCSNSTKSGHNSSKKAHHLTKRAGIWYYRHAVPERFRPILIHDEIKKSLGTTSLEIATWKAQVLESIIFLFFKTAENAQKTPGIVNWLSLKTNLMEKIENVCNYDFDPSLATDPDSFDKMIHHLFSNQNAATHTYLIPHNHSYHYPFTEQTQFFNPENPEATRPVDSFVLKTGVGSNKLLSEALDLYIEEKIRMKTWKIRTQKAEIPRIRAILHVLPDIPLKMLTHDHLRFYRQACMKLPSNWHKKQRYRNKTIKEILLMDIPEDERRSPKTIQHNLEVFRGFLNWATNQGYIYIYGMEKILTYKSTKRDHELRDILDDEDIEKILMFPAYADDANVPASHFWIPLIALFTGARLEEICQLHVDDLCEDEGISCFDFNSRNDKEVKSKSSNRLVPIHPFLLEDLNILGFVKKRKKEGETRLFPELRRHTTGQLGSGFSKWFGRQKKRFGIVPKGKGKKDFHSIRHTVTTQLKHMGVPEQMCCQLIGHQTQTATITFTRYGKPYPTSQICEVVKKISYNIDLSFLKNSHFIVR
jgi:integrase